MNTGTNGRFVVVVTGFKNKLGLVVVGRVVKINGRCVVSTVFSVIGQQTPGTNKLLKHKDSRKCVKSKSSPGQFLKSSHVPRLPSGVRQKFSPSLAS